MYEGESFTDECNTTRNSNMKTPAIYLVHVYTQDGELLVYSFRTLRDARQAKRRAEKFGNTGVISAHGVG